MLKKPFSPHFHLRSDSEESNATPVHEVFGTWLCSNASASDTKLKEPGSSKVDKEIEKSQDGETFGPCSRLFQHRTLLTFLYFKEDLVFKPMESGYFTFAKQFSTDNKASIDSTVKKVAVQASSVVNVKALEDGIVSFAEGSKILMQGLDAVAAVHPFIGGRVKFYFVKNI